MRILWITNIMMPPLALAKGLPAPAIGGWMYSSLKRLIAQPDMEVAVATVYQGKGLDVTNIDGITYFLLPLGGKNKEKYNVGLEPYWQEVKQYFRPDVVHIHGSEYPHGLAYVRACGSRGVTFSIQGIISGYARYYAAGIDFRSVKNCLTFRDFVKNDGILNGQKKFEVRGAQEKELFRSVNHIIGRTDWDRDHAWALNPAARYHYCGETLRDSFYNHTWNYSECEPHSMFVSQAAYPIKGVHMLFEALPLILREFPDAKIYVAGGNPTGSPWYRITGYGLYLKRLVARLGIAEHIVFTGMLDEKAMCERYLRSNVFVCCSSIENSPNSLGEAQLLGMPYVASFVGGIPEITMMNREALYRFEETEMLASKICDIFRKGADVKPAPFEAKRYDASANIKCLTDIYKEIANDANR